MPIGRRPSLASSSTITASLRGAFTPACTARCRHMPGWARARSSLFRSRAPWRSSTDLDAQPRALARAIGRAQRSAIGTWTFAVVAWLSREAGEPGARSAVRSSPDCRFLRRGDVVVVVPDGPPGISGADEADAFARLPKPSEQDVEHVSHLVLMALLPALADGDLDQFGRALTEIQEVTGRWFAPAQGRHVCAGPTVRW